MYQSSLKCIIEKYSFLTIEQVYNSNNINK